MRMTPEQREAFGREFQALCEKHKVQAAFLITEQPNPRQPREIAFLAGGCSLPYHLLKFMQAEALPALGVDLGPTH